MPGFLSVSLIFIKLTSVRSAMLSTENIPDAGTALA